MAKSIVKWKPIRIKTVSGREVLNQHFPNLLAMSYRGTLLEQILRMPRKAPISFERAARLASDESLKAFLLARIGNKPGESFWFEENFVSYISDQGFHIELTGEEMFPASYSDC